MCMIYSSIAFSGGVAPKYFTCVFCSDHNHKRKTHTFKSQIALKAAKQMNDGRDDEISVLRRDIEVIYDDM